MPAAVSKEKSEQLPTWGGRSMPWHYLENGQRKGPVEDAGLERLATPGTIRSRSTSGKSKT